MKRSEIIKGIKKVRSSAKTMTIVSLLSSRDADEVIYRLKEIDISNFKFAKAVYEGYQRLQSRTGGSLSYYCYLLSTKSNYRSTAFYKNWYNIYRHFCVRTNNATEELVGIDYKLLKFIAESGVVTFNEYWTKKAIDHLRKTQMPNTEKWRYIKDLKKSIISEIEYNKNLFREYEKDEDTFI